MKEENDALASTSVTIFVSFNSFDSIVKNWVIYVQRFYSNKQTEEEEESSLFFFFVAAPRCGISIETNWSHKTIIGCFQSTRARVLYLRQQQ